MIMIMIIIIIIITIKIAGGPGVARGKKFELFLA